MLLVLVSAIAAPLQQHSAAAPSLRPEALEGEARADLEASAAAASADPCATPRLGARMSSTYPATKVNGVLQTFVPGNLIDNNLSKLLLRKLAVPVRPVLLLQVPTREHDAAAHPVGGCHIDRARPHVAAPAPPESSLGAVAEATTSQRSVMKGHRGVIFIEEHTSKLSLTPY